ncbi:MAG: hypothetical protein LBJ36_08745 [Synergistaceae bacterium]|nr:hypothetical protein [Synergistaceae bacterium]
MNVNVNRRIFYLLYLPYLPFLKGKRRRGMALPLALVIVLVGSTLIAFAFHATVQFRRNTERQQEVYMEHTRVTDYVEEAKGKISDYNAHTNEALHVPNIDNDAIKIHTPQDLQITGIPGDASGSLSLDVTLPEKRQAVTLRVYDVAYSAKKLDSSIPPAILAEIPAPMLVFRKSSLDADIPMVNQGNDGSKEVSGDAYFFAGAGGSGNTFEGQDSEITRRLSLKQLGSYLVKVELFDVDGGGRRRKHLVEEAFFQISSPDS